MQIMGEAFSKHSVRNLSEVRDQVVRSVHTNLEHKFVEGLDFAIIQDKLNQYVDYLKPYNAIIIHFSQWSATKEFIRAIRTHKDLSLSLKPLFIYNLPQKSTVDPSWTIDGRVMDLNLLDDAIFQTKYIQKELLTVPEIELHPYEYPLQRTLVFNKSRGHEEIKPILSRESKMGYLFPHLSLFYDYSDKVTELSSIQDGLRQDWLVPSYLDAVHVCNHCESGFLAYREVCPSCHSSHLSEQDIIHHFRCAHVAPVSKFIQDENQSGNLSCPKCYKDLHHVGVDYDRPAVIQHCNDCHKDFQSYKVMARCCTCHQDTPVEHLKKKEIYNYIITPKGFEEALQQLKNPKPKVVPITRDPVPEWIANKKEVHELMTGMEESESRISYLSIIRINKLQEFIKVVGRGKIDTVALELASIMHEYFPENLITYHRKKFYIVHTNTSLSDLQPHYAKLDLLLRTAVQDNLGMNVEDFFGYKKIAVFDYVHEWQGVLDLVSDDEDLY